MASVAPTVAGVGGSMGIGIGSGALTLCSPSATKGLVKSSAEPFTGKTEAELNDYIDSTWKKFVVLPHYNEEIHWDVYLLYKSFFSHYSMLFVTPGHIEGFLIHLLVNEDNKTTEFRLDVVNLRSYPDKCPDLNALSLGTTEAFTAKGIITKAHDRLVKMGRYHTLFNNCRDYCKELAGDIQVKKIFEKWNEELFEILQAAARMVATGAVFASTAAASARNMQRVGPRTGNSLTKPIRNLYEYYNATTGRNV